MRLHNIISSIDLIQRRLNFEHWNGYPQFQNEHVSYCYLHGSTAIYLEYFFNTVFLPTGFRANSINIIYAQCNIIRSCHIIDNDSCRKLWDFTIHISSHSLSYKIQAVFSLDFVCDSNVYISLNWILCHGFIQPICG